MNPFKFLALSGLFYVTLLTIFGDTTQPPTPTSTTRPAPIVLYAPVTAPTTTSSTTTAPTAHDALQADLADPAAFLEVDLPADTPCQEWMPLAVQQGWPNDPTVLTVLAGRMWVESRCLAAAVNGNTGDNGLLQINPPTHREWVEATFGEPFEVAMADPAKNLRFAWMLYSSREAKGQCGWTPWGIPCP